MLPVLVLVAFVFVVEVCGGGEEAKALWLTQPPRQLLDCRR